MVLLPTPKATIAFTCGSSRLEKKLPLNFNLLEEEASSLLGINSSDWHSMDEEEVGSFIVGMKKLFGFINTKSEPEGEPTY